MEKFDRKRSMSKYSAKGAALGAAVGAFAAGTKGAVVGGAVGGYFGSKATGVSDKKQGMKETVSEFRAAKTDDAPMP